MAVYLWRAFMDDPNVDFTGRAYTATSTPERPDRLEAVLSPDGRVRPGSNHGEWELLGTVEDGELATEHYDDTPITLRTPEGYAAYDIMTIIRNGWYRGVPVQTF